MLRATLFLCLASLLSSANAWGQETSESTESTAPNAQTTEPTTTTTSEAAESAGEAAPAPEESPAPEAAPAPAETSASTEANTEPSAETAQTDATSEESSVRSTEEPDFIKGHLAHFGTTSLLSRYSHLGIATGPDFIGDKVFMRIDPGFAYYEWPVKVAMHLPLRFEVATIDDQNEIRFESFGFRTQDYDEASDYMKFVRFITYGRKEDRLFISVNSLRPSTIGHGMIVNAYQPNIGINKSMTGLLFDAYNDYGGFQFQANDITFQNRVIGGLAFIKPASFFSDHWFAKGFSIGLEYMADYAAPRCIKTREFGNCIRPSQLVIQGEALNPDTFFNDQGLPYVETQKVEALGLSVETKVAKLDNLIDFKLYATHHQFTNDGGGSGTALGGLARLNYGTNWIAALRLRGELLTYENGFLPGYFNATYEADKYSFRTVEANQSLYLTKVQSVFGDIDNGLPRPLFDRRYGLRAEASFGLFKDDRSNKKLAGLLAFQEATGDNDTEISIHLEAPFLEIVQVFGTYTRTHMESMMDLFQSDFLSSPNAMFLAGARVQVLPIFFINASYARRFQPTSDSDDNVLNQIIDIEEGGDTQRGFRAFDNVQTIFIDFELGYNL